MIELKEWWDIEYTIVSEDHLKYDKKLLLTIKNHSPYIREFKIGVEKIDVKNQINYLRTKMFLDISNPIIISVDKYRKKTIEIPIPRLALPEKDGKIIIYVENLHTKEKKNIEIFL